MQKDTLDFIAFDEAFLSGFTDYLCAESVSFEVSEQGDGGVLVSIPEDLDEALLDRIEASYDAFLDRFAAQGDVSEGDEIHLVGIQFTHQDGEVAQVRLAPELVNRLAESLSYPELQALVQEVASQVERRDNKRLCESQAEAGDT